MIKVKNNEVIAPVGAIFEVNKEFAMQFWKYSWITHKKSSKFYVRVHDRRKSSKRYYLLDLMVIKENLEDPESFTNGHRLTEIRKFTRDELIEAIESKKIRRITDDADLAMIHLYSEIKFRGDSTF